MARMSWSGARWVHEEVAPSRIEEARRRTRLSSVAAEILARRWDPIPSASDLEPRLEHLHDPYLLHGMERAVERLRRCGERGERVRIITDYDVDGTTSSLILQAALRIVMPRVQVDYHIPSRFGEGYGFSVQAARRAVEDGIGLVVTADIGVRDHQAVRAAVQGGTDVLICDHHLPPGASVPEEAIVLCPPQAACSYPNPALAACGVSLKLATALLDGHPRFESYLRSLLKLAAIGTVADMVSLLTSENRAIVALGLRELNNSRHRVGLAELLRVCCIEGPIDEVHLGFRVGPRINAAGRLEDATKVIELLQCSSREKARRLAEELDRLNRERQNIQREVVDAALNQAGVDDPFVVVAGPEEQGWHRGVVGIVASKVKERLYRPVAVVSIQGDKAVGSVRSIDGIHAVHALDAASDLLERYGGHPAAAGFTVRLDRLDALRERLCAYVLANSTPDTFVRTRKIDARVEPGAVDYRLACELRRLGPFGMKNPKPRLLLRGVRASSFWEHRSSKLLKFKVGSLQCLWWQGGAHRESLEGRPVDLLGTVGVNRWRGTETVQFEVVDARDA